MEELETSIRKLLEGKALPLGELDVRDEGPGSFMPLTKINMAYIVACVLINDQDEILMMQEAKRSCYGSWYLPAGRMEPGENLEAAAVREVQEETGLVCEPTTLIGVEFGSGIWQRFTFTGRVTGGSLKTPKQKDEESLQGKWMSVATIKSSEIELRAFDILKLIKATQDYHGMKPELRPPATLPAIQAHPSLILRLILVISSPGQKLQVLVNKKDGLHFPTGFISHRDRSTLITCLRMLKYVFAKQCPVPKLCGLLSVEHCGIPAGEHDGICYTTVWSCDVDSTNEMPPLSDSDYAWVTLEDESLDTELSSRINQNRLIPFVNLH